MPRPRTLFHRIISDLYTGGLGYHHVIGTFYADRLAGKSEMQGCGQYHTQESVVSGEPRAPVRYHQAKAGKLQSKGLHDIGVGTSPVRFRSVFSRSFIFNHIGRFVFRFVFPQLRVFNNFSASFLGSFSFVFRPDPLLSIASQLRFSKNVFFCPTFLVPKPLVHFFNDLRRNRKSRQTV